MKEMDIFIVKIDENVIEDFDNEVVENGVINKVIDMIQENLKNLKMDIVMVNNVEEGENLIEDNVILVYEICIVKVDIDIVSNDDEDWYLVIDMALENNGNLYQDYVSKKDDNIVELRDNYFVD